MFRRMMILMVGVVVLLAACGGSDGEVEQPKATTMAPATTRPLTTSVPLPEPDPVTTTTAAPIAATMTLAPEVAAMELVEGFYATLNAGEVPHAFMVIDGELRHHFDVATRGLNAQFTYSCEALTVDADYVRIRCAENVWDDFYGPAGIRHANEITYMAVGERLAVVEGHTCPAKAPEGEAWEFLQAFDRWLVTDSVQSLLWQGEGAERLLPCPPYPFMDIESPGRSPELAQEYVAFLPEFLADSDTYPLGDYEALRVIDEYYMDVADGNWERLRAIHTGYNPEQLRVAIVLNASFEHECEVLALQPRFDAVTVRCLETMHDDFYGPGGLALEATIQYRVHNGALTVAHGYGCWAQEPVGDNARYMVDFQQWLLSEGRWVPGMLEIPGGDPLSMPCGPYPFQRAPDDETLETLRQELAAFVAASPAWPKSS